MSPAAKRKLDDVLRKMLNTPPEPHKTEKKTTKKKATPKKKPA